MIRIKNNKRKKSFKNLRRKQKRIPKNDFVATVDEMKL